METQKKALNPADNNSTDSSQNAKFANLSWKYSDLKRPQAPSKWKWVILAMACVQLIATQFSYDNPAAIVYTLEADFGITQTQYSLLYSVFSLPNLFIPIFFGVILDVVGVKITLLTLCVFELIGQSIFCAGGFQHSFRMMILGRFILGIGAESIFVVANYLLSKWFDRNSFSLAYNINNSFGFLALSLNGIILPLIYNTDNMDNLGYALLIGVCLFIVALIDAYFIGLLDEIKREPRDSRSQNFHYRYIFQLNFSFWLLGGAIIFLLGSTLSFITVSTEMMQTLYKIDTITCGRLYSLPYYLLAIFGPFVGLYNMKYGNRLNLAIASVFFLVLSFLTILILPECEETCYIGVLPKVFVSISYALFYPSVFCIMPDIVPPKIMGTAFGFQSVFFNIQLLLSPIISGIIHDHTSGIKDGYQWEATFWLFETIIGLIFLVLLQIENKGTYNGKLNKSDAQNQEDEGQHQLPNPLDYSTFEQEPSSDEFDSFS